MSAETKKERLSEDRLRNMRTRLKLGLSPLDVQMERAIQQDLLDEVLALQEDLWLSMGYIHAEASLNGHAADCDECTNGIGYCKTGEILRRTVYDLLQPALRIHPKKPLRLQDADDARRAQEERGDREYRGGSRLGR